MTVAKTHRTKYKRRRLSDEQIVQAKRMFADGVKLKDIASSFKVSSTTIALWLGSERERRAKFKSRINRTHCIKCGVHYDNHLKCKGCECLLHHENTRYVKDRVEVTEQTASILTSCDKYCVWCVENRVHDPEGGGIGVLNRKGEGQVEILSQRHSLSNFTILICSGDEVVQRYIVKDSTMPLTVDVMIDDKNFTLDNRTVLNDTTAIFDLPYE